MDIQYLKTIIAVNDLGSFSKAASELCVTQSAVSQRIKFMEDRYGHKLIDRSEPVLSPTEVGQVVIAKAREIVRIEHELEEELKNIGAKTRLALCCTPTFSIVYLPKVLNDFILQKPNVVDLKFTIYTPEDAIKGLQDNEFDLCIIEHCRDMDLTGFTTIPLPRDEVVFISGSSLEIPPIVEDLAELFRYRLITRKQGCSSRSLLTTNMALLGHTIDDFSSTIIYDDLRLTIETVKNNGGISFASRSLVENLLDDGSLREHRVAGFTHTRLRSVVLSRRRHLDESMKDFLNCTSAVFGLGDVLPIFGS